MAINGTILRLIILQELKKMGSFATQYQSICTCHLLHLDMSDICGFDLSSIVSVYVQTSEYK